MRNAASLQLGAPARQHNIGVLEALIGVSKRVAQSAA